MLEKCALTTFTIWLCKFPKTLTGLEFAGRLYYEHPFVMVESVGRTPVRPATTRKDPPMATIVLAGSLQPTTRHTPRVAHASRQARRNAARTREIQRVYRRRRVSAIATLAALTMAAVISVFSVFGASANADDSTGRALAPKYMVAQPGDTLWSIGERIAPNASITEVVDELVRLNGSSISSGQLVRIP